MGIPSFYRWLVNKYPKVIVNAVQDPSSDAASPNPNGLEFDNLYLDMNGIIHPCFHPDGLSELHPTTFEEVFNSVFEYVDRLFNIVRPRKLIYFAIDGVAPRAKLNAQRSGRYQSTKNGEISDTEEKRLRREYIKAGIRLLPKTISEVDDSMIITPGTKFMYEFSKALQCYIQTRLKKNPAWKNLQVIVSDANVPGEGEQKLVYFIRSQHSLPDYDVNTRHCIHGLDADLIMLALATHELHISILREDMSGSKQEQPPPSASTSIQQIPVRRSCCYDFVHIWILKEYLELEWKGINVSEGFQFDIERAIDDFVFICFFVGNDFLPHLPSFDIREGVLELLMTVYKNDFKSLGGYLVDVEKISQANGAYLNLERVEKFVHSLATYEETILVKRTELLERKMDRVLRNLSFSKNDYARDMEIPTKILYAENDDIIKNTQQLKEELSRILREKDDVFNTGLFPEDKIKYGTNGWKDRYYQEKFGFKGHLDIQRIKDAAVKYTEGLCWVLLYYFSGVPSWSWYYPYHYGPCASDFGGIGQLRVQFEEGVPFEPFDQLMAVLGPTSVEVLPKSYRKLMTDGSSEIAHFYPREFEVDMVGRRHSWQGLCILPFIDEELLLRATRKAKEELTEDEAERNSVSTDLLLVRAFSHFGSKLLSKIMEDPSGIEGLGGFANLKVQALDSSNGDNRILCVRFDLPKLENQARARVRDNGYHPPRTVHESDVKEAVLWHEQNGSRIHRVANNTRYSGGIGRGPSTLLTSSSREGLYNHPNWSRYVENTDQNSSGVDHRGTFRPQRSRLNENNQWQSRRFASNDSSRDSGSSGRW